MSEDVKKVTIPVEELDNLKARVRNQARELSMLSETLSQKNKELDALHFVWCSGGCPGGVHRYSDTRLTEEMIRIAERNTKRLRSWYNAIKWRLTRYPTMSEWHALRVKSAASKTDLA